MPFPASDLYPSPSVFPGAGDVVVPELPSVPDEPEPLQPVTPESLSPCALRLYRQVQHLEIGDPDRGLTAEEVGYPWATICAAIARPIEPLYDLLLGGDSPMSALLDVENGPDWLLPFQANFTGAPLDGNPSPVELRMRNLARSARQRHRTEAMVAAVREEMHRLIVAAGGTPPVNGVTVVVKERAGSAYRQNVATWLSETPDAVPDGEGGYTSEALARAVKRAGVGGIVYETRVIVGGDFGTLAATHADFAEVAEDFDTFADVAADPSQT
jgi:hypothetical protein